MSIPNQDLPRKACEEPWVVREREHLVRIRADRAAWHERLGLPAPEALPFESVRALILLDRAARRSRWAA